MNASLFRSGASTPSPHPKDLAFHLEPLEPRTLLSAFAGTDLITALGLDEPIHDLTPPAGVETANFGAAVAGLGDLDGDGRPDFAIAAPGRLSENGVAAVPGHVFIYSGATGALIRTIDGPAGFGHALIAAADQNDDGAADLLVGSPFETGDTGRAVLLSGADGAVLQTFDGAAPGDRFGWSLAQLRDQNNDGRADLAVGAPGADGRGSVHIITATNTSIIVGDAAGDEFGYALSALPAVQGYGDSQLALLLVGSPGASSQTGRAVLYAADGGIRASFTGASQGDRFGHAVLALADTASGGDLTTTLFIGSPGADGPRDASEPPVTDRGSVAQAVNRSSTGSAFSLAQNDILGHPVAGARFGSAITSAGDLDNAGRDNVAISAPGSAITFLWPGLEPRADLLPGPVILAPDLDDDGFNEVFTSDASGRVRILSTLALSKPRSVLAASEDGAYIWFDGGLATPDGIISNARLFGDLQSPFIEGISNDGLIVVSADPPGLDERELYAIVGAAAPVPLASLITTREGGPDTDDFTFIAISSAGHIALAAADAALMEPDFDRPVWVLKDGVLTYLFTGNATDVNASGVVVGYRNPELNPPFGYLELAGEPVSASRAGGVGILPFPLVAPYSINNAGHIVGAVSGTSINPNLALLRDGVVTDLGHPFDGQMYRSIYRVSTAAIDDSGRITASFYGEPNQFPDIRRFIWTAEDGFRELDPLVHGARLPSGSSIKLALLDDGRILAGSEVLTPVDDDALWVLRDGAPTASIELDGVSYFISISQFNELIAFRRGDENSRTRLSADPVGDVEIALTPSLPVGANPRSPWLFVLEHGTGQIARLGVSRAAQQDTRLEFSPTPIARSLTAFASADGTPHSAGLTAAGDVVVEYYTLVQPASSSFWTSVNLSETHLRPQGLTSPAFTGSLTSYVTAWDGRNIAGTDESGQIHVVWWAPDLGPLWRVDNLSAIAGAPAVTSPLTAYLTPWDGINLAATDADGDLIVTWWAPGAQWTSDDLTAITAGPRLAPGSLTSYVTPWGGLNIAGINAATGGVTIYWWAPGVTWTAEPIIPAGSTEPPQLTALASHATPAGVLNIFGHADADVPTLLTWAPDDPIWRLLDLGV